MATSVLLGKRLRRQIRTKVWPVLEEVGFVEFGPLRAYRLGDHTIETVEFSLFASEWREPRWLGGEAYANGATFSLHVGAYFRDVERLPWIEKLDRPHAHQCHRRACLAHEDMDSACDGRTFWPGAQGERLEETIEAAIRVLRSRGLTALDGYRDVDAWLDERGEDGKTIELTLDEATEMLRICREGRAARSGALDGAHREVHLADEHTDPCSDVLAGLLIGKGRFEDAMKCVDGPKQEQLQKLAA